MSAEDVARHVAEAERCLRETEVGASFTDVMIAWSTLALAHTALAEHYRLTGPPDRCTFVHKGYGQCIGEIGHGRDPGSLRPGIIADGHFYWGAR
jgi:hypothetical protein